MRFRASGRECEKSSSFETEDIIQEELFFNLGRVLAIENRVGTPPDTTIFLRSSILKRSKQTLVPAAIVNFFSSSQGIALICYSPLELEVNGGRFLSLLVAFRNTATRRHSKINGADRTSLASIRLVPGADRVVPHICIRCIIRAF